jgi:hypothetical protein
MMNANKSLAALCAAVALVGVSLTAHAVQGLDASGQTKVNNAMAKKWSQQGQAQPQPINPQQDRKVVNIGNKREGTCSVNVGTAQADKHGRGPKDIVVTTKEVINVCK